MRDVLISIALWTGVLGISAPLVGSDAWAANGGSQGLIKSRVVESRPKPASGDSIRGEQLYQSSCVVCRARGPLAGSGLRSPTIPFCRTTRRSGRSCTKAGT